MILIFSMVGLGLAFPFLLIAFVPSAYRLLPQPGEWMDWFKQLLGFTLIATTIWLVDVLIAQIGPERAVGFLAFLMFVSLGAWIFGRWGGVAASRKHQASAFAAAVLVSAIGGYAFLDLQFAQAEECDTAEVTASDLSFDEEVPWQPFSEQAVATLQDQNMVFIDFTADWCLTCKFNERTILSTEAVRRAMQAHGVVPLKADWTRQDPVISEWLRRYQKAGVPFYLIIPKDSSQDPIPLPEVITAEMVVDALTSASKPS